MDIAKIFAELGRMHLENMQLNEQLAKAQEQLKQYSATAQAQVPPPDSAAK